MKVYIDEERPHVIRGEKGSVVAVLVNYPLCREEFGKIIVDAFNATPCGTCSAEGVVETKGEE